MAFSYDELMQRLQRESEAIASLLESLRQEYEALQSRDLETLEQVTAEKDARITRVQEAGAARVGLLQEGGFPPDAEGMQTCIEAAGSRQERLAALWEEVRGHVHACREQNERNGRLLGASLRQTQQALAILTGGGKETEIYGQDGTKSGASQSRSYAKV